MGKMYIFGRQDMRPSVCHIGQNHRFVDSMKLAPIPNQNKMAEN